MNGGGGKKEEDVSKDSGKRRGEIFAVRRMRAPGISVCVCVNQIWVGGGEEDSGSKTEEEDESESEVVDNANEKDIGTKASLLPSQRKNGSNNNKEPTRRITRTLVFQKRQISKWEPRGFHLFCASWSRGCGPAHGPSMFEVDGTVPWWTGRSAPNLLAKS